MVFLCVLLWAYMYVLYVCAFISTQRLTPSTAYSKDLFWPRPVRRPSTFTLTTANQVRTVFFPVCAWVRLCVYCLKGERVCQYVSVNSAFNKTDSRHKFPGFYVNRVSPNRGLDGSLSFHYSQEHPAGPLEPSQLHQKAGGETARICGQSVEHTHKPTPAMWEHTVTISHSTLFSLYLYRWKEPASPGSAQVHR